MAPIAASIAELPFGREFVKIVLKFIVFRHGFIILIIPLDNNKMRNNTSTDSSGFQRDFQWQKLNHIYKIVMRYNKIPRTSKNEKRLFNNDT